MKSKCRLLPIVALLLALAGSVSSSALPPSPSEKENVRKAKEPAPVFASTRSRVETAWPDSVWLWPLAGYQAGEGILCQPGGMIGKWKNRADLFLTAPEGTPVLCPEDATVELMGVIYVYPWSRPITQTIGVPFRGHTYDEAVSEMETTEDINPKYITVYTALNIGSRTVRIFGLMRERGLPEGTRLNRGDTLGTLHYGYCGFEEPNLWISIVRFNSPADPMTPFGIPTTFVAPKRLTAEQALFRRALWVAVPVLVIGLLLYMLFRLRDRRRVAYFNQLKEEMASRSAGSLSTVPPVPEPVCPDKPWDDAYRQRIAACADAVWALPSAEYLQAAMNNGTYTLTAEQIADIVRDIRTTFGDVAHDIKKSSTKVNNDEVLFCLLSCLRLPTSVMARCLYVTESTLLFLNDLRKI